MGIQRSKYVNVRERAQELNCNVPTRLALLPRNFSIAESKDALIHESSVLEIRKLWRQAGIVETKLEKDKDKFPHMQEKSFGEIGPILFISASLLSHDPYAVTIALNVVSDYLMDFLKGIPRVNSNVKFSIVRQKSEENYERYDYNGPVNGLHEFMNVIRESQNDE